MEELQLVLTAELTRNEKWTLTMIQLFEASTRKAFQDKNSVMACKIEHILGVARKEIIVH